ncbi:MAG: hypothetical protein ACI4NN_04720 [Pyramidobacter sp.]
MIVIRKAADIEELDIRAKLPAEVFREIDTLARLLDELYGEARGAESDGGIIVVAEKKSDLEIIKAEYASLSQSDCEGEDIIACPGGNYLSQLYLSNNEYGVTVVIPEKLLQKRAL